MTQVQARLAVPVTERDHARGPADAPVTLVEYGDFQCPYCGRAYPIVEALLRDFGDRLRFVFREFPLSQVHAHAEQAAEAAEAAAAQGAFWEMHDTLYEHQHALGRDDLLGYASSLGLDVDRFARALDEGRYAARVREDFMGGIRSGVNGTPTFFINGDRYDGSYDRASLAEAITSYLGGSAPTGE